MEEFTTIQCPFCGQSCEVVIDTSISQQRFTTDCEVCCRPIEIMADCSGGKIINIDVMVG